MTDDDEMDYDGPHRQDLTKVTVLLTPGAWQALELTSWAEALTKTDVINRAIVAYADIFSAPPGTVIHFDVADGRPWKTVVIPGPAPKRSLWIAWFTWIIITAFVAVLVYTILGGGR